MTSVLSHQLTLRGRCIHPSKIFVKFPDEAVEGAIVDLFQAQVSELPDKVAVMMRTPLQTYAQLNQAASQLAHALLNLPNENVEVVGLLLENGGTFVEAS